MIARRLVVHGRVQGVGYRFAMTETALSLGIAGWVRNRRDGTVEAMVQGDVGSVESLVVWCRRGPSGARVSAVDVETLDVVPALQTFGTRGTE